MESGKNRVLNIELENQKFPLAALPQYVLQKEIGCYLSLIEQDILTRMGNKNLFFAFLPGCLTATKQFLSHVVRGEKDAAEAMLKQNSSLLLNKATVTDYSGRKIHGTAWQIAAGAEDVSINEQGGKTEEEIKAKEEMLEMIERHLRLLPDGEEEIAKQKREQFPEGWEETEKARAEKDLEELNKVITAIADSNADEDCEAAIDEFRKYLQPKGIITSGKHFNVQLLNEAFKLYNQNYKRFGGWDSRKNNLAWRNIVGEIEFYLPACYAQAFCKGLYKVVDQKQPVNRSLKLDNGTHFYSRDAKSKVGLGYDFAIYSYPHSGAFACARWAVADGHLRLGRDGSTRELFENYVQQKQVCLATYLNLDITQTKRIGFI